MKKLPILLVLVLVVAGYVFIFKPGYRFDGCSCKTKFYLAYLVNCTRLCVVSDKTEVNTVPAKPEDRVSSSIVGDGVVIEIHSQSGIGSAEFSIKDGTPRNVIVKLYLKGLEGFTLSYGNIKLRKGISNHGHLITNVVDDLQPNKLLQYEKGSNYFMDVVERDGYIEVILPKDLVDRGVANFSVAWIDFYR